MSITDDYDELITRMNRRLTEVVCPACGQFTLTAERRLIAIPATMYFGGPSGTQPIMNAHSLPVIICPCGFTEEPTIVPHDD